MTPRTQEQEALIDGDIQRQEIRNERLPVETEPHDTVLAPNDMDDFRRRWREIQTSFVDEPRQSVQRADDLVGQVIDRLAESFGNERARLDRELTDNTTTEDLRQALRQYRWFLDRLLSV